MKTPLDQIRVLFLESLMNTWAQKTGVMKPTVVEFNLLAAHGWNYDEYMRENEKDLDEFKRLLLQEIRHDD